MLRLPNAFVSITWTCGLGALLVVYHYAEASLQLLRSALEKRKGWLAVFWATVNVCFLLNIYTFLRIIASACMDAKARDCSYGIIAILAGIALSGILVIVHVRKFKHSLPHPRIWQLGIPWNCFTLARVYFMLSSWINAEFRLTGRQGFRLLVATVAFVGAAGFAASLHLLLLHSKNGQKTQSISTTVFIMFSTVFPIMASWAIRTCSSEKDAASPDP